MRYSQRCFDVLASLLFVLAATFSFAADRLPIPSDAEQKAALATIKEIFKADLAAAKSPTLSVELAEKMLGNIQGEAESAATDYVLLTQAQALAAKGSSLNVTRKVITTLCDKYDSDPHALWLSALKEFAKGTTDKDFHAEVANVALNLSAECQRTEKLELASQFLTVVDGLALKLKAADLTKKSAARKLEINDQRKLVEKFTPASKTLPSKPTNSESNEAVGKYLIAVRGRWDDALQHLVLSADSSLSAVAKQDHNTLELSAVPAAEELVKLADAWWDYSQKSTSPAVKAACKLRAGQWYALALPNLKALAKAKAEQRIAESNWSAEHPSAPYMPTNVATFEVDRALIEGKGLRGNRFVICQTLSHEKALALTTRLEADGLKLSRFRPYLSPEGVKVAAIWFRSNRAGSVVEGTAADMQKHLEEANKAKRSIVDLAGYYTPEGQQRFAMIVSDFKYPEGTEFALNIGWPLASVKAPSPEGFVPLTRHYFRDAKGNCCMDIVFIKQRFRHYSAVGTRGFIEKRLEENGSLIVADVGHAPLLKRTEFGFISHNVTGSSHSLVLDKMPDAALEEWRSLKDAGWHPGGVDVVIGMDGKYYSMTVWHRAAK